jgi:hypothetical protein
MPDSGARALTHAQLGILEGLRVEYLGIESLAASKRGGLSAARGKSGIQCFTGELCGEHYSLENQRKETRPAGV